MIKKRAKIIKEEKTVFLAIAFILAWIVYCNLWWGLGVHRKILYLDNRLKDYKIEHPGAAYLSLGVYNYPYKWGSYEFQPSYFYPSACEVVYEIQHSNSEEPSYLLVSLAELDLGSIRINGSKIIVFLARTSSPIRDSVTGAPRDVNGLTFFSLNAENFSSVLKSAIASCGGGGDVQI